MSTAVDNSLRDRLKEVKDRQSSARDRRAAAKRERDAAKESFAGVEPDGRKITEMPEFEAAEEAVRKLGVIDDELNDLQMTENGLLKMLGEAQPERNSEKEAVQRVGGWSGEQLLAEAPYQEAKDRGIFDSSAKFGTIFLGQIASRDEAAQFLSALPAAPKGVVSTTTAGELIRNDFRGLQQPILRPLRFLDLVPTGTTDSNTIEYVTVTAIPGSASGVEEGAIKPEQGITLDDETAVVRTIAGWIKLNRNAMNDAPALATLVNTLLPYDVRRKVEEQVLNGDNTGQNLKGLFQHDILQGPFVAGDNLADVILRAMTTVILADGEPNFAAMHPLSWQDLLLMRTNDQGAHTGQYMYGGPQMVGSPTIWGLTITPSIGIPEATPIVGDSTGCMLLVREGVNVKTSDSDQDDFVRNRVTVLAETRVTFVVWRPSHFAKAKRS